MLSWSRQLLAVVLTLSLSSCADQTMDLSVNLAFTNGELSQQLLARINEATQAGEALGMRVIYTYPSRNRGQGQVSSVQPSSAKPFYEPQEEGSTVRVPRWETARAPGINFAGGSITLAGLPLGFRDTEIIVEILQQGAEDQWYVIGFTCFKPAEGQVLTSDLLGRHNGASLELTWGRSCGRCSDNEADFVEPDSTSDICNDGV